MALQGSHPPDDEGHDEISEAHPALHPSITCVPVTPGVNTSGHSSYFQTSRPSTANPEGSPWKASSDFASHEDSAAPSSENPPDSPTQAAAGARTGAELLRRLSLVDTVKPEVVDSDPRAVHPGLNLTGGLISATFCIPHAVTFRGGADWVCHLYFLFKGVADVSSISNQGVVHPRSSTPSRTSPLRRRLGTILS